MVKSVCVAALVFLLSSGVCSTPEWQWSFSHAYVLGTSASANDGYDEHDRLTPSHWAGRLIGMHHDQGVEEWLGPSGFYSTDIRAPLGTTPGLSKTWRIYLWADPGYLGQWIGLAWFPGSGISQELMKQVEFRLTYVRRAVGISYDAHTEGDYWILNNYPDGSGTGSFPAFRTSNGLDGYIFDFTATVVPEPSSLLALAAGVFPLAGMALRRRM